MPRVPPDERYPTPSDFPEMLQSALNPIFLIRLAIGVVVTAATAWGIAIYAVNFGMAGFESADNTLTQSMANLSNQIQSESEERRGDRNALAADIAERVAAVQESQDQSTEDLNQDLRDLTGQLRETTRTLAALSESVGKLDTSIQAVDEKLTGSINRQEQFERFVVGVLIQTPPPPLRTSDEVQKEWGVDPMIYNATVLPIAEGKSVYGWWEAINK